MLTKTEEQQILHLLKSPNWITAERFVEHVCDAWSKDTTVRDTEWDTIRTTLTRDGKIQGVREFIQELYKVAQKANDTI